MSAVLPFDDPFTLSGPAGEQLLNVRLLYAPAARLSKENCKYGFALVDEGPKDINGVLGIGPSDIQTATWTAQNQVVYADSFRLHMQPLRANTDYTFCLRQQRTPSKEDLVKYRAGIVSDLWEAAKTIREQFPQGGLDETTIRPLQTALRNKLPNPEAIREEAGSVFNLHADIHSVAPVFAHLLEPFDRHAVQLENVQHQDTVLQRRFSMLPTQHEAALRSIAAIGWKGRSDKETNQLIVLSALAWSIHEFPSNTDIVSAIIAGKTALGSARAPIGLSIRPTEWDTLSLEARTRNIDSSMAAVGELESLVSRLIDSDTLMTVKGPKASRERLVALNVSLKELRDDLLIRRDAFSAIRDIVLTSLREATKLANTVLYLVLPNVVLEASTSADYKTRARTYVSADVGLVYLTRVGGAFTPYAGVNFYVKPVNKKAPLWHCPWDARECLLKAISGTVGLTTSGIEKPGKIQNLFGSQNALTGIGVRVTDALRLGVSNFWFREVTSGAGETRIISRPAISASIDLDFRDVFGAFGNLLPK